MWRFAASLRKGGYEGPNLHLLHNTMSRSSTYKQNSLPRSWHTSVLISSVISRRADVRRYAESHFVPSGSSLNFVSCSDPSIQDDESHGMRRGNYGRAFVTGTSSAGNRSTTRGRDGWAHAVHRASPVGVRKMCRPSPPAVSSWPTPIPTLRVPIMLSYAD